MDKIALSVNSLYERYPYPSLPIRNERDLVSKLHANVMSKILATAGLEPFSIRGKDVLDAGCGTGEKSCYFSYYGAKVTAIDLCSSSLAKGKKLACLGVLHHTRDPYMRFRVLAGLCKPGGTLTVGLYNRYGRAIHRARRMWITLNAGNDIEKRMSFVESSIYRRKLKNGQSFFSQLKWLIKRNGFFIL